MPVDKVGNPKCHVKAKGELRYKVQNLENLSPSRSIYVNGKVCKLLSVNRDVICVERNHEIVDQGVARVQQRHELCDDKDLRRAFTGYWTQFWNTVPDLKILSDGIVKDLVSILTSYDDGWPAWISSRVNARKLRRGNHTRPITVTSLLWRWWASTLARQVLATWANSLPRSVFGGVPNSSVHDVAMQAHASGTPVAGFTLDIVKCFNCIPRQPTRMLLQRLGIPEKLFKHGTAVCNV